jgi:ubiquinone/menaquinone biosynthesis C-methylase UbiE
MTATDVGQGTWQLTGDAAERYERYVARYILAPWAPLLVDAARLQPGERALDVACGTGVVARTAAERVGPAGQVTGIDLNAGMIRVARSLPRPAGARIEWLERSALDLGLADASVDAVFCQQGLQFFPDKPRALREMRRVLRRAGRLALSVWTGIGVYNAAVGAALARVLAAETAERFLASRRAPGEEELRRLAIEAGFAAVDVRISRREIRLPPVDRFALDHLAATPVADAVTAAGREARQQIALSIAEALQRFADRDGIAYPEETYVLTAEAVE